MDRFSKILEQSERFAAEQARTVALACPPPFIVQIIEEQAKAAEREARLLEPVREMLERGRELADRFRPPAFLQQAKVAAEAAWLTGSLAAGQAESLQLTRASAAAVEDAIENAARWRDHPKPTFSVSFQPPISATIAHETNDNLRELIANVELLREQEKQRAERAEARAKWMQGFAIVGAVGTVYGIAKDWIAAGALSVVDLFADLADLVRAAL